MGLLLRDSLYVDSWRHGTIAIARCLYAKIAQWGSKYKGQGWRLFTVAEWALIRVEATLMY